MKKNYIVKKLVLTSLLITSFVASSQSDVSVPDLVFENYLETHDANGNVVSVGDAASMGNGTDADGIVLKSRIENVVDLNINAIGVASVVGIEEFTLLEDFRCDDNSLTVLDMSSNTALEILRCEDNAITALDMTSNIALEQLYARNNSITVLDISTNVNLTRLYLNSNAGLGAGSGLDVTNNTLLVFLYANNVGLTSIDLSNNDNLRRIILSNNSITTLDLDNKPDLQHLYLNELQISDSDFSVLSDSQSNLQRFNVAGNLLFTGASMDLSNYTALQRYWAHRTSVTSLDFSSSTTIEDIYVNDNASLTSLVVPSNSTTLQSVRVNASGLTTLDVSNTTIDELYCYSQVGDGLETLNISNTPNLENLRSYNNALLGDLDVSANTALTYLRCNGNGLAALNTTNLTALTYLRCNNNNLTALNTSNLTALEELRANTNNIEEIDVTNSPNLETILVNSNSIGLLDFSQNPLLTNVQCDNNQLVILNLANGNTDGIVTFDATDNDDLECVQVDEIGTWTTDNASEIDGTASFSVDCNFLAVEDYEFDNFELYPIPSDGMITVSISEEVEYQLIDVTGQVLEKGELEVGENRLNFERFLSGMYFVTIKNENTFQTVKIILK